MKKARLLLLVLPVIGAAFYMRSLASWRPQKVVVAEGPISGLVFSDDGKTLLVEHLPPRPAGGTGNGLIAFSPETVVAFDAQNNFKFLWKRDHDLAQFFSKTVPAFFSHDSKILVQPGTAEILDAHTGKTLQTNSLNGNYAASPDGKWLAYARPIERLWDRLPPIDGQIYLNPTSIPRRQDEVIVAEKIIGQKNATPPAFCFSPDGLTLAVGAGDKSGAHIDFYSTKTWKLTRTWSDVAPSLINLHPSYQTLQWSRDGQFLFSSLTRTSLSHFTNEMGQKVWRVRDGKKVASGILLDNPHLEDHACVLSFGGDDGQVNLSLPSDLNHNFKRLLQLPNQQITAAALSPDGSYLVAGTRSGTVYRQRLE